MDEIDAFRQIRDWAKLTETGDRAELTFLPDDSDLWTRIDARRTPARERSARLQPCFLTAMQQRAREADLIIVNHHLFFATLPSNRIFGSILPNTRRRLRRGARDGDVASDYFGRQISNYRFEELARDADQTLRLLHLGSPSLLRKTQRIRNAAGAFSSCSRRATDVFRSRERARGFLSRTAKPTTHS